MAKNILVFVLTLGILGSALPVFAATTPTAASISCVSSAVTTREQVIGGAMTTYTGALNTAYSTRATALQQAYSPTADKSVIAKAVKTAWSNFNSALKSGRKTWQTSRNSAWSQFRKAIKVCRAPVAVVSTDLANSISEASGQ